MRQVRPKATGAMVGSRAEYTTSAGVSDMPANMVHAPSSAARLVGLVLSSVLICKYIYVPIIPMHGIHGFSIGTTPMIGSAEPTAAIPMQPPVVM